MTRNRLKVIIQTVACYMPLKGMTQKQSEDEMIWQIERNGMVDFMRLQHMGRDSRPYTALRGCLQQEAVNEVFLAYDRHN